MLVCHVDLIAPILYCSTDSISNASKWNRRLYAPGGLLQDFPDELLIVILPHVPHVVLVILIPIRACFIVILVLCVSLAGSNLTHQHLIWACIQDTIMVLHSSQGFNQLETL